MRHWIRKTLSTHRSSLCLILGIQLLIALLVAIQPLYMQRLVGVIVGGNLDSSISQLFSPALILAGLMGLVALCQGLSGYHAALFSSELLRQLQTDFFQKVTRLPLNYFRQSSAGEFFTRFNHDVGQAQCFIASTLPNFIREAITAFALAVVLLWLCPIQLVVFGVVIIVSTSLLAWQCHRLLERYAIRQRAGWSEINRHFDETVRGIDTVKTFGAEEKNNRMFTRRTAHFRKLSADAGKVSALFSPVISLAANLGGLALVLLACVLMVGNSLDLDTFLLFFFCATLLQGSVTEMFNLYTRMPPQVLGIRNLTTFFYEDDECSLDGAAATGQDFATLDESLPIEFNDLHFAYPGGRELYHGINITFPANSISLVAGANGCGKSTLINLLLKFNEPKGGAIAIGGKPLSGFSRKELRSKISVVTQYHHIFNDTLRENLLLAKPNASDEELTAVLEQVGMTAFLQRQPEGLEKMLDSSGKLISGGERQRICIARLLLRDSPILVLDEPWSNLDNEAGKLLSHLLLQLRQSCTLIVIAHHSDNLRIDYDSTVNLGPTENGPRLKEKNTAIKNMKAELFCRHCSESIFSGLENPHHE